MINLLIVDDDVLCVRGIQFSVDWKAIGIDEVYTAYSMKQAQQVFSEHEVHIALCDVEMPKGSGLDLLQWVKEQGYSVVSILLTSYATFNYAQQAIELKCMDYLLKPVAQQALENTLAQAVKLTNEKRKSSQNNILANYWNDNEYARTRQFWSEVLNGMTEPTRIGAYLEKNHITIAVKDQYAILYILVYGADTAWEQEVLGYAIQNVLQETIFDNQLQIVLNPAENSWVVIAHQDQNKPRNMLELVHRCHDFVRNCHQYLAIETACFFEDFIHIESLSAQWRRLRQLEHNHVTKVAGVYMQNYDNSAASYQRPVIEQWMELFSQEKYDVVNQQLDGYLDHLISARQINAEILNQFFHDFMQELYIAAGRKGIQAHLLFDDAESVKLYESATESISNLKKWAHYVISKSAQYIDLIENTDSVVLRVQKYIQAHFSEELTREQLAEHVYLSPDYLSRVFHKEAGMSISEYMTQERLKEAKKLLADTDIPVAEITFRAGYTNWAYFSKVFKDKTGKTPVQYRTECRK